MTKVVWKVGKVGSDLGTRRLINRWVPVSVHTGSSGLNLECGVVIHHIDIYMIRSMERRALSPQCYLGLDRLFVVPASTCTNTSIV